MWQLDSVIDTGAGAIPDELVDSEMCEIYGWTWQELQDTPWYVRRAFWEVQQLKIAKREQEQRRQQHPEGTQVISHA